MKTKNIYTLRFGWMGRRRHKHLINTFFNHSENKSDHHALFRKNFQHILTLARKSVASLVKRFTMVQSVPWTQEAADKGGDVVVTRLQKPKTKGKNTHQGKRREFLEFQFGRSRLEVKTGWERFAKPLRMQNDLLVDFLAFNTKFQFYNSSQRKKLSERRGTLICCVNKLFFFEDSLFKRLEIITE